MLLAICTTQVKKRVKKEKRKKKITKNFIQGDSNPEPQNTLKLKMNASIHWYTSVNANNYSIKVVYIPSLW